MPTFSFDYDDELPSEPAPGMDLSRIKLPRGVRTKQRKRRPRKHRRQHQQDTGSQTASLPSVVTVDSSIESEINWRNAEKQREYEAANDPDIDEYVHHPEPESEPDPEPENPYIDATYGDIPPEHVHISSCAGCMLCTDSVGERLIPPLLRRRMIHAEMNPHLQQTSFIVLNCGNPACPVEMHLRTCLHGCEFCAGNWGTLAIHDEIGYRLVTGRLGSVGDPLGREREAAPANDQPLEVDLSERSIFLLQMAIKEGQHKPQSISSIIWGLYMSLCFVVIFVVLAMFALVLQQMLREETYVSPQGWVRG